MQGGEGYIMHVYIHSGLATSYYFGVLIVLHAEYDQAVSYSGPKLGLVDIIYDKSREDSRG